MIADRVFLDTSYVQAVVDARDQHHRVAVGLYGLIRSAKIWTTEAILLEIGNALSAIDRIEASKFIANAYITPNIQVVAMTTELLGAGLSLYRARGDKAWGLTDCISFVVMTRLGLNIALTSDRHFVQAGFRALMLEEP